MTYLPQILFIALLGGMSYLIFQRFSLIIQTIRLARPVELSDHPSERFKRMALLAFGQKKMFSKPVVGFFHFLIYIGFVLINIEVLEIILDGILGTHRLFVPFLGSFYAGLMNFFEILAGGVFLACVFFFLRRGVFRTSRLQAANHKELTGFPVKDAYQILLIEVILMLALWTMNGADAVLQMRGVEHYQPVGSFVISGQLISIFLQLSTSALILLERAAWWFHILGILSFALYVTYSKHLHIFFAFPSAYFSSLESSAKMSAMPAVTHEVKLMLGQPVEEQPLTNAKFGAKDVMDLTWKNALDAYSCTECGRCTEQCPANQTGRALSPRKIMMDTRDRLEEVGGILKANKGAFVEDGKSLFDRISAEELRACTSCQACVEACPMELSPLNIILEMRRFQIMELSDAPGAWNAMFANVETNQSPWKFNPADRLNWAKE
ncbi:(Fe-S)-binding protein [Aquirufa antheringensis]|uniref:(Fe-S)-binding protein n=2 Tax=Aquirufa antheringensis TaxID=2516559 RepID=A0A4Q9BDK1_9BACT|nr:(Fe-S)-binding protein [Aquirufa antheringensis]MCZ2484547.1 (Fe-S)-binding protein [Aquirufa antheringensis]TBH74250.1 (Fe-S)-binding protein [Aquirufa antheringensis]